MKLKNKSNKFDTIERLRTTLQSYKSNTLFEVEEREKRGKEKNYYQSSFMPWMSTRTAPPCRGWDAASDTTLKSY